ADLAGLVEADIAPPGRELAQPDGRDVGDLAPAADQLGDARGVDRSLSVTRRQGLRAAISVDSEHWSTPGQVRISIAIEHPDTPSHAGTVELQTPVSARCAGTVDLTALADLRWLAEKD